jgi:CRP-like cAMP-binding protein
MLSKRPHWWRHLGVLAFENGNIAANAAADLKIRDSKRRCIAALLRLSGCRFSDPAEETPIEVMLTQEELAAMANMSRNNIGEVLRKLAERRLIELGYRTIIVRAPAALRAIIDSI